MSTPIITSTCIVYSIIEKKIISQASFIYWQRTSTEETSETAIAQIISSPWYVTCAKKVSYAHAHSFSEDESHEYSWNEAPKVQEKKIRGRCSRGFCLPGENVSGGKISWRFSGDFAPLSRADENPGSFQGIMSAVPVEFVRLPFSTVWIQDYDHLVPPHKIAWHYTVSTP